MVAPRYHPTGVRYGVRGTYKVDSRFVTPFFSIQTFHIATRVECPQGKEVPRTLRALGVDPGEMGTGGGGEVPSTHFTKQAAQAHARLIRAISLLPVRTDKRRRGSGLKLGWTVKRDVTRLSSFDKNAHGEVQQATDVSAR